MHLRSLLGSAALPCPAIDIGPAFAAIADTALNTTLCPPFDPYADEIFFLVGAFFIEDVAVSAYLGAIETRNVSQTGLSTLAGLLGIEGYHAGAVRQLMIDNQEVFTPYEVTIAYFSRALAALRDALDGPGKQDAGILNANGHVIVGPVDANGMPFPRSTAQVLSIVYGGGTNGGLFFPQGLNGGIR